MKHKLFIFLFSSIIIFSVANAQNIDLPLLKWMGPQGSRADTYNEWVLSHPNSHMIISSIYNSQYKRDSSKAIAILTENIIAPYLETEINQLIEKLENEGYYVLSYEISGGTPESIRTLLQQLYSEYYVEGALFIGDLPVAWYQIENDYNEYGYAEWPIDYYFMDLDGLWLDNLMHASDTLVYGTDSIYDTHTGNIEPEIYISRLMPTGIGDDVSLLKNYFTKDFDYRAQDNEIEHRALVFVDDDWEPWSYDFAFEVALLYPDTYLTYEINETRATNYRIDLDSSWAWVSVFSHSWPGGHSFYYDNHNQIDYYYSTEYTDQDPNVNFYNFFACSFARYTTDGYGAGRALFNQDYSLAAVGSTKTGSMLDAVYFYSSLSQGKTLGEAYKDWFYTITSDGISFDELCWFYGMTLLGDPTLKPLGQNVNLTDYNTNTLLVSVYPNPTNGIINLKISDPNLYDVSIEIIDIMGRTINKFTKDCHNAMCEETIDLSNLTNGIYFLKLSNNAKYSIIKLLKQ
ncbi:MAG: T9SS type A sorting domain-containing protein [Bacteroidales bacterium]|nr:T9SS type A sorting domain-containing protein [Bacteroidales bacterium]